MRIVRIKYDYDIEIILQFVCKILFYLIVKNFIELFKCGWE